MVSGEFQSALGYDNFLVVLSKSLWLELEAIETVWLPSKAIVHLLFVP